MTETAKRVRVKIANVMKLPHDAPDETLGVKFPTYGSDGAAGMDLYAAENVTFRKGETKTVGLGFATELPDDVHARIEARSSLALKNLVVLTGVIDADYRGEWKVILHFLGPCEANGYAESFTVAKGDRIAQAVLRPTIRAVLDPVEELGTTGRGAAGFGSTGAR